MVDGHPTAGSFGTSAARVSHLQEHTDLIVSTPFPKAGSWEERNSDLMSQVQNTIHGPLHLGHMSVFAGTIHKKYRVCSYLGPPFEILTSWCAWCYRPSLFDTTINIILEYS